MKWLVRVKGIVWDDGKGEYDVSDLPSAFSINVEAPDAQAALEYALTELSDDAGSLIEAIDNDFSIQRIADA